MTTAPRPPKKPENDQIYVGIMLILMFVIIYHSLKAFPL